MSSGIVIKGRQVILTVGGSGLAGVTSKSITLTNENLDTTDDNSGGWQEFAATPSLKSAEFSISGKLKNLELIQAYVADPDTGSQMFAISKTYPDGSVLTFDAVLNNVSPGGEHNGETTFEASFNSSGVITFTPGV